MQKRNSKLLPNGIFIFLNLDSSYSANCCFVVTSKTEKSHQLSLFGFAWCARFRFVSLSLYPHIFFTLYLSSSLSLSLSLSYLRFFDFWPYLWTLKNSNFLSFAFPRSIWFLCPLFFSLYSSCLKFFHFRRMSNPTCSNQHKHLCRLKKWSIHGLVFFIFDFSAVNRK